MPVQLCRLLPAMQPVIRQICLVDSAGWREGEGGDEQRPRRSAAAARAATAKRCRQLVAMPMTAGSLELALEAAATQRPRAQGWAHQSRTKRLDRDATTLVECHRAWMLCGTADMGRKLGMGEPPCSASQKRRLQATSKATGSPTLRSARQWRRSSASAAQPRCRRSTGPSRQPGSIPTARR